jgi:hypothetical protein
MSHPKTPKSTSTAIQFKVNIAYWYLDEILGNVLAITLIK